jgi:hypothetical protein
MREQERLRIGTLPNLVNKMQVDASDPGLELGKSIDRRFMASPVVIVPPVLAQVAQISGVDAKSPGLAGPAIAFSPVALASRRASIRNVDFEMADW